MERGAIRAGGPPWLLAGRRVQGWIGRARGGAAWRLGLAAASSGIAPTTVRRMSASSRSLGRARRGGERGSSASEPARSDGGSAGRGSFSGRRSAQAQTRRRAAEFGEAQGAREVRSRGAPGIAESGLSCGREGDHAFGGRSGQCRCEIDGRGRRPGSRSVGGSTMGRNIRGGCTFVVASPAGQFLWRRNRGAQSATAAAGCFDLQRRWLIGRERDQRLGLRREQSARAAPEGGGGRSAESGSGSCGRWTGRGLSVFGSACGEEMLARRSRCRSTSAIGATFPKSRARMEPASSRLVRRSVMADQRPGRAEVERPAVSHSAARGSNRRAGVARSLAPRPAAHVSTIVLPASGPRGAVAAPWRWELPARGLAKSLCRAGAAGSAAGLWLFGARRFHRGIRGAAWKS